jgi:hypothetical protein
MKTRVLSGLFLLILTCQMGVFPALSGNAFAAERAPEPSAPPSLFKKSAPESFRCQRMFVYDGKVYGCDSNVRPDGEGIRPLLSDVPAANAELNIYQTNRATLRNTAYVGSLGLALMISAAFLGKGHGKQALLLGGGSITAGSFIYGFTSARANERHLDEAVRLHNLAKPDKPIELQFSTGIGF